MAQPPSPSHHLGGRGGELWLMSAISPVSTLIKSIWLRKIFADMIFDIADMTTKLTNLHWQLFANMENREFHGLSHPVSIFYYHSFTLMISFISIFLEWLMFSYFLIHSFIMAKSPKKFCSHWVGEFHPRSCMYYCGKNVKSFLSASFVMYKFISSF